MKRGDAYYNYKSKGTFARRSTSALLCLLSMVATAADHPPSVTIPALDRSAEILTDGVIAETIWKESATIALGQSNSIKIMSLPDALAFAICSDGSTARYADLYFLMDDQRILNLHASMQMGMRTLIGDDWTDERPEWHWGNSALWRANITRLRDDADNEAPFPAQIQEMDGYEFVVSKALVGKGPWRVLVEYRDFVGLSDPVSLPATASRHATDSWLSISEDGSQSQQSDQDAVIAVVEGIIAADNVEDIERVLDYYAEDALLIAPKSANVAGLDAIRKHYEALFASADLVIESRIDDIVLADDWAIVLGLNYVASTPAGAANTVCVASKYLMTLKRLPDGWKIEHLMWSNQTHPHQSAPSPCNH